MGKSFSVKIKYYDGSVNKVDKENKEAVKKSLKTAVEKLQPAIFKGLSIHVASDFSNLDEHNDLSSDLLKNESKYSNLNGITTTNPFDKEIYIQESSFFTKKVFNLFTKFSFKAKSEIEQSTMHEIGHQVNLFGGEDFYKKGYSELIKKVKDDNNYELSKEENCFFNEYWNHNEYSDKEEYKQALYEDLQTIKIKDYNEDFYYYVSEFYDKNNIPTKEDVEKSDYCRGEIFAQLFSYVMETDDGNKKKFIKLFPKTYKIVADCVNKLSKKPSTNNT